MRIPNNWCWSVGAKLKGGDRITEDTLGIAHGAVPDGDDAATRGCLLEQVRDKWHDPRTFAVPMWKRWRVTVHTAAGKRYYFGPTEWDALSFALDGSNDVAQADLLPDWKMRAMVAEKKLKALAGLVTFRGHDTRCNAFSDNAADCGCGYITARAEARRLCGVDNG